MKKKQITESDFDFFNVTSELKNVKSKQKEDDKAKGEESGDATKKLNRQPKKQPIKKEVKKRQPQKLDDLFVVEVEEKDPFKTVQIRTSLWNKAEAISKKIEDKSGKKYSATKVLNRILEDYFDKQ